MIWAEKLSKRNTSARGMLSQARRLVTDDDSTFLCHLDIETPIQGNIEGLWWGRRYSRMV